MEEFRTARPHPALAGMVAPYIGYAQEHRGGGPPVHLGLPSGAVTVAVSLREPMDLLGGPGAEQGPVRLQAVVGGLHMRPVLLGRCGPERGVQLAVHPLAVRALLGVGAAELTGTAVDAADLPVPWARLLPERLARARGWAEVFAEVDRALLWGLERSGARGSAPAELAFAWRLLRAEGPVRVQKVADSVGWSRRHLAQRMGAEVGVTPKQAARLARFERSTRALRARPPGLASVAAACGFADQAHMTNEWRELAGCTPTQWIRDELPFLQDLPVPAGPS
ncbi:AraC family transcriptional regulator [Nocardiopsis sp. RSe5-2]|uniref:AraC family transcriptional regulator n=1 Tax=Nocardiopsis endophytica TaxID=3018445 RepID=A0ABT4TYQ0_9ACTN|nr:AraC family transcriptional regulator [Nocardiopsis endophytica]MDA2809797.1 AraC family transcriptional regulator [Nocardiopsis endophytica]